MTNIQISDLQRTTVLRNDTDIPIDNGNRTYKISSEDFLTNAYEPIKKYAEMAKAYAEGSTYSYNNNYTETKVGTGVTTAYTLLRVPTDIHEVLVNGNSVPYTLSGSTVTLDEAPPIDADIEISYYITVTESTSGGNAKYYSEIAENAATVASTASASVATAKSQIDEYKSRLDNDITTVNQSASSAASAAERAFNYAENAEGSADDASASATSARQSATTAEDAATSASDSANSASSHATAASTYASSAAGSATDAEAWANGKRNGTAVTNSDSTYHNNAEYFAGVAHDEADRATGAILHAPRVENGRWQVWDSARGVYADAGINAQGPQGDPGANGVSITNIAKTSTSGLEDTYTITYSNGTTSTFKVRNGEDGEPGSGTGDMLASRYDPTNAVNNSGGIAQYVASAISNKQDKVGVVSKQANGLVPALPNESTTTKFLRQDGTWVKPPNDNTTYQNKPAINGGSDVSLVTTGEKDSWNKKVSSVTAGTAPTDGKVRASAVAGGVTNNVDMAVAGWDRLIGKETEIVTGAVGATSASFNNPYPSITDLSIMPYCENTSGTPIPITSYSVTVNTITLNFSALTEATRFKCRVTKNV